MRLSPWTLSLLIAWHASVAAAEDLVPQQEPRRDPTKSVTLRAIRLREPAREEPADVTPTRERWIDRFGTSKGGLKYQDTLTLGGRRYRYNVRGPVQKDKRLGVTFELRF